MTFDNFLTHFNLSYNPSFEEYKRDFKIYLSGGLTINLDTSRVHNKNKSLWTEEYKNNFIKASYEAFIVHKLDFLKSFYDTQIKPIDDELEIQNCSNDEILSWKVNNKLSKYPRSWFFREIYSTTRSLPDKGRKRPYPSFFEILKVSIEKPWCSNRLKSGDIRNHRFLLNRDYKGIFTLLRGTTGKASVLNPNVVGNLLKEFNTKKLFTPVLSWGSYAIACDILGIDTYHGVDVIPNVVNTLSEKFPKYNFTCCPSESLDTTDLNAKFDTVLLSPPYFNLELYQSKNQSHESYSNYQDWLINYWEATVKKCHDVLEFGGIFSFIITPIITTDGEQRHIGDDLQNIVQKYFSKLSTKYIKMSAQKSIVKSKQRNMNIEEVLIFNKKTGH